MSFAPYTRVPRGDARCLLATQAGNAEHRETAAALPGMLLGRGGSESDMGAVKHSCYLRGESLRHAPKTWVGTEKQRKLQNQATAHTMNDAHTNVISDAEHSLQLCHALVQPRLTVISKPYVKRIHLTFQNAV